VNAEAVRRDGEPLLIYSEKEDETASAS